MLYENKLIESSPQTYEVRTTFASLLQQGTLRHREIILLKSSWLMNAELGFKSGQCSYSVCLLECYALLKGRDKTWPWGLQNRDTRQRSPSVLLLKLAVGCCWSINERTGKGAALWWRKWRGTQRWSKRFEKCDPEGLVSGYCIEFRVR